jgi:transcriptional regulator with PAS, ATPase and Fis domain
VSKGRFRQDLFYRINVVSIHCHRCASGRDVLKLASHFLKKSADRTGQGYGTFSPPWRAPARLRLAGNVRELENCVEPR